MRKEQEIFTQVNAQNVPVGADILDTLEQEVVNESIFREFLREYIREMLTEKKLRGQKTKRTLYHINKRPATPQPKVTYWEQWDPKATDRDTGEKTGDFVKVPDTDIWKRHWLDSPVKSGVFLTPNPLDIAMNHGRAGHVYAYKVPEWVIDKSGGMHRYDTGSEVLIPEDVWNEAGKEIEFMGKSMEEEALWDKMTGEMYGRGHHRPATKPSWMSDEELKQWQVGQDKFNLTGLRSTKHPEDVIKLLTPEERRKAIEAIEAKNKNDPTRIEKGSSKSSKGFVIPGTAPGIDKKNQELLALLKKHMAESMVREYIREMLIEKIEGWDYLSPPRDFKDKTGIDMIHDYRLPPEYTSPEALQDYIEGNEPKDSQEATQFYSSIVDNLVELNPELAPIVGTGAPDESGLLPDQQLSDVYPWHLKDIVMGVASEFPPADIKHYLGGPAPSSKDEETIQALTDQTGVRPQWIISPETAAKHLDIREDRIREYIREMLNEASDSWKDIANETIARFNGKIIDEVSDFIEVQFPEEQMAKFAERLLRRDLKHRMVNVTRDKNFLELQSGTSWQGRQPMHLRESLLSEAAKGPKNLPDGIFVKIFDEQEKVLVQYVEEDGNPVGHGSRPTPKGTPWGSITMYRSPTGDYSLLGGHCGDAWVVMDSTALPGWGPMLYDVAMEFATLNGGGLMSDRGGVSPSARKVWAYYMDKRPDVTAHQLDDPENTLTPEEEDNCDQEVAGYDITGPDDWYSGDPASHVDVDWPESPLSKRYTAPPTMMNKLEAAGKLMES